MRAAVLLLLTCFIMVSGCGYTSNSLLPPEQDSIHVTNFVNKIDIGAQVSNRRVDYTYRPGLENDITRAVIDQFIIDRALSIKRPDEAVLLMKGELTSFRQFPIIYNTDDDVEAYRIEILVNMGLYDNRTGDLIWQENEFMGQTEYTVEGPNAKTESMATQDAVQDLAGRIRERTIEAW